MLYTIPTGSNPTGYTLSEERRSQLLDIAAAHGLIVLEDDPYYFLQYSPEPVQSLFSMAPDRVLRFDSFSKVISSGEGCAHTGIGKRSKRIHCYLALRGCLQASGLALSRGRQSLWIKLICIRKLPTCMPPGCPKPCCLVYSGIGQWATRACWQTWAWTSTLSK